MVKISIIIPVYNTAKYLRDCLDSLIKQTFQNFEAICIDDGSKDNSLDILKEYEKLDPRFNVYSQENKGVSATRNRGIDIATGEYIVFLDSDDWFAPNALEILFDTAQKRQSEIIMFSHYKYTQASIIDDGRLLNFAEKTKGQNTTFNESYDLISKSPTMLGGKFYKSALLKNNNIKFPIDIKCTEDKVFFIKACIYANSISAINMPLYYYRLDTENSLTKNSLNAISHTYKGNEVIKNLMYNSNKIKNPNDVYKSFWATTVQTTLYYWNSCHHKFSKPQNYKYLKALKNDPKKNKKNDVYKMLCHNIILYKTLFIRKLLEPIIEIEMEQRRNRIVIYWLEKQIINLSTHNFSKILLKLKQFMLLTKLRFIAKRRKITVGFWVTDIQKWTCQSFYEALDKSKHFEPIIFLAYFKNPEGSLSPQATLEQNEKFFQKLNNKYCRIYNVETLQHLPINDFKTDILFYQQPWSIPDNQGLSLTNKYALTCYIPYCFYSMASRFNYLKGFHGKLWKYFVETKSHETNYKKAYNADNCVGLGSVKFDNYKLLKQEHKHKKRKCVLYAPHHSFEDFADHAVATFEKNGDFILNLAKSHPEIDWVFRPHPVFLDKVLKNKIKTLKEIQEYYEEWEKIGRISGRDSNYYEDFINSDCLITDCISFLAEYLPSEKPVIHLRSQRQLYAYNELLTKITNDYYQAYDNETLLNIFNDVVVNDNDYLKEKRLKNLALLMIDENKTTGEKIKEHLEQELWLRR